MGEALLIKSNSYKVNSPLDDVDIMAGYCAILAIVRDSGGNLIPNIPVNCYDGGVWYNNTTNTLGMALFYTNSGNARLSTTNVCSIENYTMADQIIPSPIVIQRENGTKVMANFNFNRIETGTVLRYRSTTNNIRFMDTHNVYVQMVGGGGGGAATSGGGGGAYNEANVTIDRSRIYHISIGSGGSARGNQSSFLYAGNGGTTSAFDISALGGSGGRTSNMNSPSRYGGIGGGSGNFKGGDGGSCYNNGSPSAYANANFNFGGGGAGGTSYYIGSNVPVYTTIDYGGWRDDRGEYNLRTYFANGTPVNGLYISSMRYGANGGGNTSGVGISSSNRFALYIYDPINSDFYNLNYGFKNLNHYVDSPTNLSMRGNMGVNGGGGSAGGTFSNSTYINLNLVGCYPGEGGTGLCWVTILD